MIEPTASEQNPTTRPRGYRYDAYAVDKAAARIVTDVGGPTEEAWKDDPRNVAQGVLDIFIAAGVVILAGDAS